MRQATTTATTTPTATRVKALFTIKEACEFLGISRTQLNRLINQRSLTRVHIAKHAARVTASSLEAYLAELEANAA